MPSQKTAALISNLAWIFRDSRAVFLPREHEARRGGGGERGGMRGEKGRGERRREGYVSLGKVGGNVKFSSARFKSASK